jgi:hypothetical protein
MVEDTISTITHYGSSIKLKQEPEKIFTYRVPQFMSTPSNCEFEGYKIVKSESDRDSEVDDLQRSESCEEDDIECLDYDIDLSEARVINFVVMATYKTEVYGFTKDIEIHVLNKTESEKHWNLDHLSNSGPYFKTAPYDITQEMLKNKYEYPDGTIVEQKVEPKDIIIPTAVLFGAIDDQKDKITTKLESPVEFIK